MPWRRIAYRAIRPLLFRFDSEEIHRVQPLRAAPRGRQPARARRWPRLAGGASLDGADVEVAGLRFPQPGGPGRRLRQGCGRASRLGSPGTRLRRDRHGHAPAAGRESAAAPLPAAERPGAHQPDGLQQRRRGGGCAPPGRARAAGCPRDFVVGVNIGRNASTAAEDTIRDYLAVQRPARPACRLLGGQRLLPQHAGPARPPVTEAAARAARRPGGRRPASSAPRGRSSSSSPRTCSPARWRRSSTAVLAHARQGADPRQHDHLPGSPGSGRRARRGGGRPLRRTAADPDPRPRSPRPGARRTSAGDHRLGRHRLRRGRRNPHRRRRRPGPAVDRARLRRAGADRRNDESGAAPPEAG